MITRWLEQKFKKINYWVYTNQRRFVTKSFEMLKHWWCYIAQMRCKYIYKFRRLTSFFPMKKKTKFSKLLMWSITWNWRRHLVFETKVVNRSRIPGPGSEGQPVQPMFVCPVHSSQILLNKFVALDKMHWTRVKQSGLFNWLGFAPVVWIPKKENICQPN